MGSSGLVIRHADESDRQALAHFTRATLAADQAWGGDEINPAEGFWSDYGEKFKQYLKEDHRLFLIAQADGPPLGCLCGKALELHPSFSSKKLFHIAIVYVAPEARQRGVATRLLQAALEWAAAQGCQESSLNVMAANERALRLYEKLGFGSFQHQLRIPLQTQT